jgi:hypothetical protein
MLLCRLQVSFRIPQVGLGGSYMLLSGHLGSRRCQSDLRWHRPAGTRYLTPQYAKSRGDDWEPLLNHLGPLLQLGYSLSGQLHLGASRFVIGAEGLISLGPVAFLTFPVFLLPFFQEFII